MDSIRYQQRRSESHPKKMMRIGDTKIFATKPQCSFQEFYVKKEYLQGDEDDESSFFFYAVSPRAANGFNIMTSWFYSFLFLITGQISKTIKLMHNDIFIQGCFLS